MAKQKAVLTLTVVYETSDEDFSPTDELNHLVSFACDRGLLTNFKDAEVDSYEHTIHVMDVKEFVPEDVLPIPLHDSTQIIRGRIFQTLGEAQAFQEGIEYVNDKSISVKDIRCDPNPKIHRWTVIFQDADDKEE